MQAWRLLFSSDFGLYTVVGFVIMFVMMAYFIWMFTFKKDKPASLERSGRIERTGG